MFEGRMSITEIAEKLGVTTKTITRWEKSGKIKPAKRDWKGWRVYSSDDLEAMKSLIEAVY
ncbi:MAG: MerR family transcriptional regulator [Candidatus Omnitrophica bacterium]|nr:MerR family transcriptional regulator [Candidatus Omnitrophota bacterium]MBI3009539.1 MerR family transcriptional regulator [Candidatus Omnitrophota bacterium]